MDKFQKSRHVIKNILLLFTFLGAPFAFKIFGELGPLEYLEEFTSGLHSI